MTPRATQNLIRFEHLQWRERSVVQRLRAKGKIKIGGAGSARKTGKEGSSRASRSDWKISIETRTQNTNMRWVDCCSLGFEEVCQQKATIFVRGDLGTVRGLPDSADTLSYDRCRT